DAAFAFLDLASYVCTPLLDVLGAREKLAKAGIDLADVVRAAFERTIEHCKEAMGEDPRAWSWGRMHPLVARSRLHGTPLGPFFDIGPEPAPGAPDTVNRGDFDGGNSYGVRVAAAMRCIVSAKFHDKAGTVLPGGQ